jgi:hypothetical protein
MSDILTDFARLEQEVDGLWDMYCRMKALAARYMLDSSMLTWLENQKGLDLRSSNMEWTRPDGTKFTEPFSLCANRIAYGPQETLRKTILAAMATK